MVKMIFDPKAGRFTPKYVLPMPPKPKPEPEPEPTPSTVFEERVKAARLGLPVSVVKALEEKKPMPVVEPSSVVTKLKPPVVTRPPTVFEERVKAARLGMPVSVMRVLDKKKPTMLGPPAPPPSQVTLLTPPEPEPISIVYDKSYTIKWTTATGERKTTQVTGKGLDKIQSQIASQGGYITSMGGVGEKPFWEGDPAAEARAREWYRYTREGGVPSDIAAQIEVSPQLKAAAVNEAIYKTLVYERSIGRISNEEFNAKTNRLLNEGYSKLSDRGKASYNVKFLFQTGEWREQGIKPEEIKFYPGGLQYLKSLSQTERRKLVEKYLSDVKASGGLPFDFANKYAAAGGIYGVRTKEALDALKREFSWEVITMAASERKEKYFGELPGPVRLYASGFHAVASAATFPITIPEAVIGYYRPKFVKRVSLALQTFHPGGPRGAITTGIGAGISGLTKGEWETYETEMARKYPIEFIFATGGELLGLWMGGKFVKVPYGLAKAGAVRYAFKPAFRGTARIVGKLERFGIKGPVYVVKRLGRIPVLRGVSKAEKVMTFGQRVMEWTKGAQPGYDIPIKVAKDATRVTGHIRVAGDKIPVQLWGQVKKFAGRGKRIWLSAEEVARIKAAGGIEYIWKMGITPGGKFYAQHLVLAEKYAAKRLLWRKAVKVEKASARAEVISRYGRKPLPPSRQIAPGKIVIKETKPPHEIVKVREWTKGGFEMPKRELPKAKLPWEKTKIESEAVRKFRQYQETVRKGYPLKGPPKIIKGPLEPPKPPIVGKTFLMYEPRESMWIIRDPTIRYVKGVKGKVVAPELPRTVETILHKYRKDLPRDILGGRPAGPSEPFIRYAPHKIRPGGPTARFELEAARRARIIGMIKPETVRMPVSEFKTTFISEVASATIGALALAQKQRREHQRRLIQEQKDIQRRISERATGRLNLQLQLQLQAQQQRQAQKQVQKQIEKEEEKTRFKPPITSERFVTRFRVPPFIPLVKAKERKRPPIGKRKPPKRLRYVEREFWVPSYVKFEPYKPTPNKPLLHKAELHTAAPRTLRM